MLFRFLSIFPNILEKFLGIFSTSLCISSNLTCHLCTFSGFSHNLFSFLRIFSCIVYDVTENPNAEETTNSHNNTEVMSAALGSFSN